MKLISNASAFAAVKMTAFQKKIMKKFKWFFVAFFVFSSLAYGQNKLLTVDDIFDPKLRVSFSGSPTYGLNWTNDGTAFLQPERKEEDVIFVRADAVSGETAPFYDSAEVANAISKIGVPVAEAQEIARTNSFITNKAQNAFLINSGTNLFYYDALTKEAKQLTNDQIEELEADFSPDGKKVSFIRANNMFVVDIATKKETQLTSDGSRTILNGYLDWVYEEELYGRGNKRGYFWSPDSTAIAFLRTDESPVPKFVLTDDIPTDQNVENTDYPQAGDPNPFVKLAVGEISNGKLTFVDVSKYKPEDFLISRVAWSPDSKNVVYQAQNRTQTFLDLNSADRQTGKTTLLFKETSPAWVEVIDNAEYLKDGSFIWQSARTGFSHLYHFDKNGKLIKQLTDGRWEVRDFDGVDEKNGFVYFSGTKDSPIETHVYRVKLDGTNLTRLTKQAGSHSAVFNPTFTHFVDTWSDVNTPTQTRLYKADGTLEKIINENKVPELAQYKLGKPEFLQIKTRDGFEMEAMMIKPPDFDPSKKYPVMSYTYSGPHAPQVRNSWGGSRYMWHQLLAQKGYIIWILDNRTASGKGVESTWKVYKQMGRLELEDLEDGVKYLKTQPFVDGERLGIWGWSYGGFMTTYALTHSDSWKMGIAGGSVTDWALYDSIYTERYMLTPEENPEGYKNTSVLNAAKNLDAKLLLIHGVMDNNVHLQNTTKLVYELQKAGKQFDLMIYPTQRHGVSDREQVYHMYSMMTKFISENL